MAENATQEAASNPSEQTSTKAPQQASPAQDLRDIQNLLLGGIFPGNIAPAIVKAYSLLEKMANEVEAKNATK